jgi:hypothetical protein
MERVYFTDYRGRRVLVQDLSGLQDVRECIAIFDRAEAIIVKEPPKSVRLLTDVSDAHYDRDGVERMKRFSIAVTPHMQASAVVGVSGLKKIVVQTLIKLTGRHIALCDSQTKALEWLTEH